MGAAVAALDLATSPEVWEGFGFTVDADGGCRVGQTLLRVGRAGEGAAGATGAAPQGGAAPAGLPGWALRDARGDGAVDGIPTERVAWPPAPAATHANGALSVDHVVVGTPDIARTFAALEAVGMALRRERDAGTPERPLRQGFFRHGECIVEVVGPPDAGGEGPATLWGLTLVVADLDVAAGVLGERLGRVKDAVQPGRRIATVRREAGAGVPLALMSC